MRYDFDAMMERRGSGSLKWDDSERRFGVGDLLPLWVADMDFPSPPGVIEALRKRADHGIYGYGAVRKDYPRVLVDWLQKRHDWPVEESQVTISPGVIPALNTIIRTFASPGNGVILQPPVYPPFYRSIENNGCTVLANPLKREGDRYVMDFAGLETLMGPRVKLMILCSPHNPVGRVWEREELARLGKICRNHDLLVISDEIHSDLVLKGRHIPFPLAGLEFSRHSVVLTSTSKTFNLAGLQGSSTLIANPELRRRFRHAQQAQGFNRLNIFAQAAVEAAYTGGEEWLEELLSYLRGNLNFFLEFVGENMPLLQVTPPEGTYLVWMDCRALGMEDKELMDFFLREAGVAFNPGYPFGTGGQGFVRVNIACPRILLREALERVKAALARRGFLRGLDGGACGEGKPGD